MDSLLSNACARFHGLSSEDALGFLTDFESYATLHHLQDDDAKKTAAFYLMLKESARIWYLTLPEADKISWDKLKQAFSHRFATLDPHNNPQLLAEAEMFSKLKLANDQEIENFHAMVLQKGSRLGKSNRDLMLKFVEGLPHNLAFFVRAARPDTLDAALLAAKTGEAYGYRQRTPRYASVQEQSLTTTLPSGGAEGATPDDEIAHLKRQMSQLMDAVGRLESVHVSGRSDQPRRQQQNSPEGMGGLWENKAFEICEKELGTDKFHKRLGKYAQIKSAGFGSKTRLSLEELKAKKTLRGTDAFILHYNAVGAVGYAVVLDEPAIPENEFFIPGKRFRIRLRHSNLRCNDDAAACQREAAFKFADQNEDGPLDLILLTGRTAIARNCKSFMDITSKKRPDEVQDMCMKDPFYYFSLNDGLRRSPDSFANLVYHSQVPYRFIPDDGRERLVKFRLISAANVQETGLLDENDQSHPWETSRRANEVRPPKYLRSEFLKRIETGSVKYFLQMQTQNNCDDAFWNPQQIWDEEECPWINLMELNLTTPLTPTALLRTYFNITDKPICLKFPAPSSVHDYRSLAHLFCSLYTHIEIKRIGHPGLRSDAGLRSDCGQDLETGYVTLCTGPKREARPRVDVFITLTGTKGRSTPKRLDTAVEDENFKRTDDEEHFEIQTEPIGDLVSVTIAVRHRNLTDDWYLRYVVVSNRSLSIVRHFPCHSIVLSKVTLRPGEASLPQHNCHEVLRQERLLELRTRENDYGWQKSDGLPSHVKGRGLKDLPANELLHAEKYSGIVWEIDHSLSEVFLPMTQNAMSPTGSVSSGLQTRASDQGIAARRGTMRRQPAFHRQTSAPGAMQNRMVLAKSIGNKATARWKKLKLAIQFLQKIRLPDGPQGEMCKLVQDDVDFGRYFQNGTNPNILQRCEELPAKFPLNHELVEAVLDRRKSLTEEGRIGHLYVVDYALLDGVPTYHADADHRYLAAPICLFYMRSSDQLIPLAIQLNQVPGPDNPIFTAKDKPEDWLMAKLWVKFADFIHQHCISHVLKCHLLIEPFAVATMRQLSTSHPVYKILKPHFRYTLCANAMMRSHVLRKGGAFDRYTSVGSEGFRCLAKRYFSTFNFNELDVPADLERRGVHDFEKLPNYFYREDAMKLWQAVSDYITNLLTLTYKSDNDVIEDYELQDWIKDINENGFSALKNEEDRGLPSKLRSIPEMTALVTKVLFSATCQHAAVHSDALDLYGFVPMTPAMMRCPPPTAKGLVTREMLVKTLPEQYPEAYYGSLTCVLFTCKPDQNQLGCNIETYFVEAEAQVIKNTFREELKRISMLANARNKATGATYDSLIPERIPNAVELLPFCPEDSGEGMSMGDGRTRPFFMGGPSVPMVTMPLCMNFARNLGGRSFLGRRMSVQVFSRAMQGVNLDRMAVPMSAIDRKRHAFSMNQSNYNLSMAAMYNGGLF